MSEITQVRTSVMVTVPKDWIEYVVRYPDLFMRDYCGMWFRQIDFQKDVGHLVRDVMATANFRDETNERNDAKASQAWKDGKKLPRYYYVWDKELAIKAFVEGCKRYGVNWYQDSQTDANTYDYVMQMATLGEHRYA